MRFKVFSDDINVDFLFLQNLDCDFVDIASFTKTRDLWKGNLALQRLHSRRETRGFPRLFPSWLHSGAALWGQLQLQRRPHCNARIARPFCEMKKSGIYPYLHKSRSERHVSRYSKSRECARAGASARLRVCKCISFAGRGRRGRRGCSGRYGWWTIGMVV